MFVADFVIRPAPPLPSPFFDPKITPKFFTLELIQLKQLSCRIVNISLQYICGFFYKIGQIHVFDQMQILIMTLMPNLRYKYILWMEC